jgi:hypothetical protein
VRRCTLLALTLALLPAPLRAQAVVVSPGPEKVAVTVYRNPHGGGALELDWLQGFALVSEIRRVSIPAGETELRFEGVAGGLVPQSAVVSGLGDDVIEKNRDAKLLSPGTLLDAHLGRRVHLRRTSRATGAVREQEAVVRGSGDGVVIETEGGVEALRCTGLAETLIANEVPATLAARPTLSVKVRAERPIETEVNLTYLTTGFDWRAHYVGTLSPDGRSLSLFAWLTLANGDETGFADAQAMAVAGRLNREEAERLRPEFRPINITCWPQQRTHEIPLEEPPPPPPPAAMSSPPPPPPMPERGGEEIVLTGSRIMAQREALGDLKLYRIPIPVTVAARSQKQVALIEQPKARVERFYRLRTYLSNGQLEPLPAQQILAMENREKDGLGLPLPAGGFTLYTMRGGQRFLLGEGSMTDRAVGEKVEVVLSEAPGVRVMHRPVEREGGELVTELVATNEQPTAVRFEAQFLGESRVVRSSEKLVRRDGMWVWSINLPANGSRTLRVRYREAG